MGRKSQERDPRTGRFAPRRPVPDVNAESRFDPMADSIEDIEDVSATDVRPGMSAVRHAPEADQLAQGGQQTPVGIRQATLVHPDDSSFHNAHLRSAARSAGPADPTPFLTGLDGPETPAGGRESAVHVYRDGGAVMSPTRAEDIAPGWGRSRG